jgi:hypothetical protein
MIVTYRRQKWKALDDRQKKYDAIYEEIQDLKKQGR